MWSYLLYLCLGVTAANVTPRIGERYNYFNVELLHTLIEDNDDNLIVSPASAKLALAIFGEGTGGRTRQELLSALRLPNDNAKIRETVSRSIAALKKNESGTELSAHSSLWIQEQLNILSEYKNVVEQQYDTNIQSLNFANSKDAADTINAWVRSVTRHKINSLVEAGSIHPNTRLVLASALYFKGQWRTAFNKYLTRIRCFNVPNNGCKNAPFMAITSMFPYAEVSSLDAQVIGLQYSDQRTMMLIVLPNHAETDQNLRILSKDLSYIPVSTLLSDLQTTEVNVLLPKFSINSKLDLRSSLNRIGIRDLFEMSANLSGIVRDDALAAASVVQNAKIEVDEDGTVAAAVTGISVVPLIGSSTLVFNANRPFIFMIVDSDTKETLFSGRFMQPN